MKGKDLWKLSEAELKKELENCQEALLKLRFQKVVDELVDPTEIRHTRRKIARIRTVMRLQEIELEKAKDSNTSIEK